MKRKVFIRADGGSTIGLGHLVRCIALGQMLVKEFQIVFISKGLPQSIEDELKVNHFGYIPIQDESEFFNMLTPSHTVVLDGYSFTTDYQRKVKSVKCKLVCIDDLHSIEFMADLIINHAPEVKPEDYKAKPYTAFALGPDFALLRNSFLKEARKEHTGGSIETLLICFGGSDYLNLSETALQSALAFLQFKKVNLVTGASFKRTETLDKLINEDSRVKHFHDISEKKLCSLMVESHLAIVPSSGLLYETLAVGCKVISGMYVENQKYIFEAFKAIKAFESADNFEKVKLDKAISNSLKKNTPAAEIIDGYSGRRLLEIFNSFN